MSTPKEVAFSKHSWQLQIQIYCLWVWPIFLLLVDPNYCIYRTISLLKEEKERESVIKHTHTPRSGPSMRPTDSCFREQIGEGRCPLPISLLPELEKGVWKKKRVDWVKSAFADFRMHIKSPS